MSETNKMNLMQKIARARVLLQKKNLKKSGLNKFAGFKYFELADFLPSVNEIFDSLGLYAEFYINPEETSTNKETGVTEVTPEIAYLYIYNTESNENPRCFISSVAEAGTKGATPIQQLGSVHTYMRRYLYMEALEIVESDAVDAVSEEQKATPSSKKKNDAPQQKEHQKPNIIDPADMAVELTRLRTELTKGGVDIRSEAFVEYVKKTAQVNTIEPGMLLGDPPAMNRVIQVMRAIIQTKS